MSPARGDCGMALPGVVCAVPTDTADLLILRDLHQQIGEHRRIALSVGGDLNSPSIEGFRVNSDMDLAPLATIGSAKFAGLPLTLTHHLDAGDSKPHGVAFDRAYAANEVAYRKAVNDVLSGTLILAAQNSELKGLLETGLKLFQENEQHAEHRVAQLRQGPGRGQSQIDQRAEDARHRHVVRRWSGVSCSRGRQNLYRGRQQNELRPRPSARAGGGYCAVGE